MRRTRRKQHHKKNSNSLGLAIGLIIFALIIVTGSRMFETEEPIIPKSYGAHLAISTSKDMPETTMVSQSEVPAGTVIDEYKNIAVYSNGKNYMSSHGLNYSSDDYYFGYKWQCVEYVKRFYYEIYGHKMPDGAGNAKYFYNPILDQGELNKQRGLTQYKNGGDEKPRPGDLLVFTDGAYGHVAIVSDVGKEWLEVIQQNSEFPREIYEIRIENGNYTIIGEREPAGWLRK